MVPFYKDWFECLKFHRKPMFFTLVLSLLINFGVNRFNFTYQTLDTIHLWLVSWVLIVTVLVTTIRKFGPK